MIGTEPIKIEQPFEGDDKVYYVNGGRCSGKVDKIINELVDCINELQQENQKYKEVIDKAIEYINHFSKESEVKIYGLPKCKVFIGDIEQLLEILNEVSK